MAIAPDTQVRLCSNVPISPEHQMTFNDKDEQYEYFNSKAPMLRFADFSYQREEVAVIVPMSYDEIYTCNYMMYRNRSFTDKWFYAFITKKEYINPNAAKVYFELDVYQTYQFDMNFLQSYVVREHANRYNASGDVILNTVDEGLDYGTEYDTVSVTHVQPMDHKWLVIVSKTPFHEDTAIKGKVTPTVLGSPQPLSVYVVPFKNDDTVPNIVTPDGMGVLLSKPSEILKGVYSDTDAVNNVVSIYITDYPGIVGSYDSGDNTLTLAQGNTITGVQVSDGSSGFFNVLYVEKIPGLGVLTEYLGDKYSGYGTYFAEPKLLNYPYTVLILDDFKGNRVTYKNEYIEEDDLFLDIKGSIGTSNKVSYGFSSYNLQTTSFENETSDEYALIDNDPNDVPIVTDLLSAYIQGNKNQLATRKDAAVFGAVTGVASAVMGGMSAQMIPNPLGIAASINEGVSSVGNAYFDIQQMQSKKQDISNMPPNLSKQGSNSNYHMGNDYGGVFVIKKQIKYEYRLKIANYLKMFGYKVNALKMPNLKTREHFNYVQTLGANITGNIPQEDLQILKSWFDRGITLWHGNWVCDYSLSNNEV